VADGEGSPPPEVAYLLDWFTELSGRRTHGGMAANPITFPDIEAWARLTGQRPRPWEVRVLTRLDDALQQRAAKSAGERDKAGDGPEAVKALMMSLPGQKKKKPRGGGEPKAGPAQAPSPQSRLRSAPQGAATAPAE